MIKLTGRETAKMYAARKRARLKPCPFCGHSVNHPGSITDRTAEMVFITLVNYCKDVWYVLCEKCQSRGPEGKTEKKARDMWNLWRKP